MSLLAQLRLFPDVTAPSLRDIADAVRTSGLDGLSEAVRRADQASYQEVHVRSAMAQAKGMPFKWTLNPYRGCTHACQYCYARKYQRHLELDAGDAFSSVILVKQNLPRVLARELARPRWTRETVAVGTATDPYQPIEGHYRLTRQCLQALVAARTPFTIVTKGPMVVRDADVLVEATRGAGCRVAVSVPSVDETAWMRLEPGTASPSQRLRAARYLRDAGIDAGVVMMPLVPGITTDESSIRRTVTAIADAGLPCVGSNVAHFERGVREHFQGFLQREYPHLLDGYRRLYDSRGYPPRAYAKAIRARVHAARDAASSGPRLHTPARS